MVQHAYAAKDSLKRIFDAENDDVEWQVNCVALIAESPVEVKLALKASLLALQGRISDRDDKDYDVKIEIDTALQGCC